MQIKSPDFKHVCHSVSGFLYKPCFQIYDDYKSKSIKSIRPKEHTRTPYNNNKCSKVRQALNYLINIIGRTNENVNNTYLLKKFAIVHKTFRIIQCFKTKLVNASQKRKYTIGTQIKTAYQYVYRVEQIDCGRKRSWSLRAKPAWRAGPLSITMLQPPMAINTNTV